MQADAPVAAAFASPMDAVSGQRVTLTGTGSTRHHHLLRVAAGAGNGDRGRRGHAAGRFHRHRALERRGAGHRREPGLAERGGPGRGHLQRPRGLRRTARLRAGGRAGPPGPAHRRWRPSSVVVPDPDGTGRPAPVADAGQDQTVRRGATVQLDGSRSALVDEYAWTQVSGPAVSLTGAATATPTFTMPLMPLPSEHDRPEPVVRDHRRAGRPAAHGHRAGRPAVDGRGHGLAGGRDPGDHRGRVPRRSGVAGLGDLVRPRRATGGGRPRRHPDRAGPRVHHGRRRRAPGRSAARGTSTPPAATTTVSAVSAVGGCSTGFTFRRR